MLSPPSELTNNSPLTNNAATDKSERFSMCSAAAGSTSVRGRRGIRPNECSQDLSDTAGKPFPDKCGPEVSLSVAESTPRASRLGLDTAFCAAARRLKDGYVAVEAFRVPCEGGNGACLAVIDARLTLYDPLKLDR